MASITTYLGGYKMNYYEDEPTREEYEEMTGMDDTKTKITKNKIKVEFDTVNFANGIADSVAGDLKAYVYNAITTDIKDAIFKDIKQQIEIEIHDIIKAIIDDYMNTEMITIGGNGWDNTPKEKYTMKEYARKCLKDCIDNQEIQIITDVERSSDRYARPDRITTKKLTFEEYIKSELAIGNEVKVYLDEQIDQVRKLVNKDVKNMFDDSIKTMLSDTVVNLLMSNETYKKIESNISNIANKK